MRDPQVIDGLIFFVLACLVVATALLLGVMRNVKRMDYQPEQRRLTPGSQYRHERRFCLNHERRLIQKD